MPQQVLTDVVKIDKNTQNIEEKLHNIINCEIIRWAVVEAGQDYLKICYSYKK